MVAKTLVTDKTIRIARSFSYPKYLVYVLVGLLGLVSLFHFARLLLRLVFRQRPTHPDVWRSKRPLLRRWPLAAADWLRAKSMRKTVRLLWGAQLNWAEGALTVGYLTLLLAFVFYGSESQSFSSHTTPTWKPDPRVYNIATTLKGERVEPHYYANRAGTIAASQFPIVTALGMRNNPFSCMSRFFLFRCIN